MDRDTLIGAPISFAVGRNGDKSARIRRVIAIAVAQGDQQTVELAEGRLRYIQATRPQLPAFVHQTCQDKHHDKNTMEAATGAGQRRWTFRSCGYVFDPVDSPMGAHGLQDLAVRQLRPGNSSELQIVGIAMALKWSSGDE